MNSSNTKAYYLDGDSDVGYLTLDGRTGNAIHLPANPRTRYAVAVSPDDSRIAIASLEYLLTGPIGRPDVKLNLFVQDLNGGHRVELFSSTSVTEWPIGWHDGHLVVAVGPTGLVQYVPSNPYFATEYHVADTTTGARLATLGGIVPDECLYGALVRGGVGCIFNDGNLGYQSWNGSRYPFAQQPALGLQPVALSPDGSRLAGSHVGRPKDANLALISSSGITELSVKGLIQGWLDDEHLVYFEVATNKSLLLDLVTGVSVVVPQETPQPLPDSPAAYLQFLGTVPQQMS